MARTPARTVRFGQATIIPIKPRYSGHTRQASRSRPRKIRSLARSGSVTLSYVSELNALLDSRRHTPQILKRRGLRHATGNLPSSLRVSHSTSSSASPCRSKDPSPRSSTRANDQLPIDIRSTCTETTVGASDAASNMKSNPTTRSTGHFKDSGPELTISVGEKEKLPMESRSTCADTAASATEVAPVEKVFTTFADSGGLDWEQVSSPPPSLFSLQSLEQALPD
ncbi:hypothetical protein J3R30DRAFT_3481200 [Lentinula aciculospora]|uniref:Uncharacterized protein n=1 Tax=Lentinula aciculospora TaxID=153920 RepID=A0A9W9ABL8_9AGAR|nr:hypothetical protein J3R30DRAFT_3481200 [Lentinula aciculospora]